MRLCQMKRADIRKVYKEEAESKIQLRKSKSRKPYITEEVFQLAKDKSKTCKPHHIEYKRLKKKIRQ